MWFSADIFNPNSEAIVRELVVQPGFIISGYNFNALPAMSHI